MVKWAMGLRKHGKNGTPEHTTWSAMRQRCYDPKKDNYSHYGGRGITVCDEWRADFARFFADMGPRPSMAHTLNRIDNGGPYAPHNCRWSTKQEQANNRRSSRYLTLNGEQKTIAEWSRVVGIHQDRIWNRIHQLRWSVADAITKPLQNQGRH